jgi:RHS repeat-associated protein
MSASGAMTRGFVYLGGQLLAVQQNSQVSWVHQDPVAKSKRVTNGSGTVISTVELDAWGGDTNRSSNEALQPRRFTTYDRDGNASDEAMHRRYNRWHMRFDQPDPYGGSYDMTNPQSLNRYSYVLNDPVNFVDPSGLDPPGVLGGLLGGGTVIGPGTSTVTIYIGNSVLGGTGGGGGGGDMIAINENERGMIPDDGLGPIEEPQEPQCTFNINISGVSGQQLADMQNEIARIFGSANFNVVFGQPSQANAGSMNLVVTSQFTGAASSRNASISVLGATLIGSGESQVNTTHIFLTTNTFRDIVARPTTNASYGTMYGRIGAHEVIAHGLLERRGHPINIPRDITNPSNRETLVSKFNAHWNISSTTAQELRANCP